MSKFEILTESTCDLLPQLAEKLKLHVVRLHVLLDGKDYENYLDGRELSFKDLYDSMRNKKLPTTSQVNIESFKEEMESIFKQEKDILYVAISGAMSGTLCAGKMAAEELKEKYPDRKVLIVDSLGASMGEGLLVYLAAKKKEKGATLEETFDYTRSLVPNLSHLFMVQDLMHICRGGRANKSAAIMGSVLNIKPVMNVTEDGVLNVVQKVQGRKTGIKRMVNMVKENILSVDQPVFVGHGDCLAEAEAFAQKLKDEIGIKTVYINYIGAVCGCHTGPGILGVFYLGKTR
ncbi:MAG: DegV family protein [Lachnospiraceae bacterium]|nr:DegV family protein [Lachnospiraceae bacterium]